MSMLCRVRHYSTSTPLTAIQKTRNALHLLKIEKNPERILEICRAASLTPDSHLDRAAFSLAISKLSAANHFDGIRQFLEDLKTRPDLRNERFLSHAMVLYGQASMLDHAIRTFKQMEEELRIPRSVKSLNALLLSALLANNYKEVSRIYLEFPAIYSIQPTVDTYNIVIKAFCESGSSGSVYSVLAQMDRNSVKPNATTFSTFIAGCYKEEKFEEVGNVLQLMKDKYRMYPSLSTYNVRIQSLCKLKRPAEAKALLEGMICNGRKPNSVTYSHLIHGFCKEGNLDEASRLFNQMKQRGHLPDSHCYFTLVHFLCKAGHFDSALDISKECMAKGWVPNSTTMRNLVNGLVATSKPHDAKHLINQIKDKFPESAHKWDEIQAELPQS